MYLFVPEVLVVDLIDRRAVFRVRHFDEGGRLEFEREVAQCERDAADGFEVVGRVCRPVARSTRPFASVDRTSNPAAETVSAASPVVLAR
ncbi:hypothetical protein ACFQMM_04295 [Saliphagus sp. GCM10025308]